jgi:DNA-binding SARP family transcriptional activator/TolB-like protein
MSLRLTVLGAPRVYHDGVELQELPAQRLRFALLAYLAVEVEAPREGVLAMFWPDRTAERGRHALRQMLYELRQLLGEEWIEAGRERITVRADVDLAAFVAAAATGDTASALQLYGGEFLTGFNLDNRAFEGWVDRRRALAGRLHRRLRRERIDTLLDAGNVAAAAAEAQLWVELDPLEDEANHALIRCVALAGHRLEALQRYESYERQLAAELQVEPLDETKALVERIRQGETPGRLDELAAAGDGLGGSPPVGGSGNGLGGSQPAGGSSDGLGGSQLPAVTGESAGGPQAPAEEATGGPHLHGPATGGTLSVTPPTSSVTQSSAVPHGAAEQRQRSGRPRWWRPALAAAGLVALLSAGALMYRGESPGVPRGTPGARLIVLPFLDRSDDTTLVSLAGALTEALARNLAQSRPLDVVSPTGVTLLRGQGLSDDSVGRLLRADYLVSGSLTGSSDRVWVNVELLDGRTGSLVRSDVVERSRAESRILVEDVVASTAVILRREIGRQVDVQRVRASTSSEEAWRNVLEARALQGPLSRFIRYRDYVELERVMAVSDSLLTRAAELDRRWAEPLVMRGRLMERRAYVAEFSQPVGDTAARRKLLEAARSLTDKATERDPAEPSAYELRGALLHQLALLPGLSQDTVRGRLTAAEEQFRRAIQLDPNSASSWRQLAELLTAAGRYGAAKTAAERAWTIDRYVPEANSIINLMFTTSLELGEDSDAAQWCTEGRRSFPNQLPFVYCLFAIHAWADQVQPDLALLQREMAIYRASQLVLQPQLLARFETLLAMAYHRAGQPDSARAILRRVAAGPEDRGLLWLRAGVLAGMGDDDGAIGSLAAYLERGGSWDDYRVAQSRPFWRLRGRPEYQQLIRP